MKALSFATVFAALSGFVLMLIAARALGDIRSAELMAYWGLFFACTGFIDGLMQETTRAVAASTSDTENAARPASVGTLIAIGIGALALVVTPFVVTYLLSSDYPLAVGLFVVGTRTRRCCLVCCLGWGCGGSMRAWSRWIRGFVLCWSCARGYWDGVCLFSCSSP